MNRLRTLSAGCLLIALRGACGTLRAQTQGERVAISAWYDSVAHLTSESQLARFDSLSLLPVGALKSLRRSIFKLHSGELLHDASAINTGMDNLAQDLAEHPDWVWPRFALARALVSRHTEGAQNGIWPGQLNGESLVESAWRQLRLMLERDPNFPEGLAYSLDLLVRGGDRLLLKDQNDPLHNELAKLHPDARALLVWGRILLGNELYDSSLRVFTRAAFAGEDLSRLALERAHAFLGLKDTASAREAYWDGLEHLTKSGREAYRYDLAWMLSNDSLAIFDKVPDDSLVPWMHRFWDERDASVAHHSGERLLEQLRRWNFVVAHFRVNQPWRKTDFYDRLSPMRTMCTESDTLFYKTLPGLQQTLPGDIRDREPLIDQRGLVYLHHGAPVQIIQHFSPDDGESWQYWFEGNWRLLHFTSSLGFGTEESTGLRALPKLNSEVFADFLKAGMSEYRDAERAFRVSDWMVRTDVPNELGLLACNHEEIYNVIKKSQQDVRLAIETDSDSPPLLAAWNGVVGVFGLGNAVEHNGKALITYALPAEKLKSEKGPKGHPVWFIRQRIVAYERNTGQTIERDSLRSFDARRASKNQYLTGWVDLPLGPGDWQIAIRINQHNDSTGVFALQKHLVIENTLALSLSDIVLGASRATAWRAPDRRTFPVNPVGVWQRKATMEIYFELRGVPQGAQYKTSIQMHEKEATGKSLINVTSTDNSTGVFTPVRKAIALDALKPGVYVAVVTIIANGKSVERSTSFTVVKP